MNYMNLFCIAILVAMVAVVYSSPASDDLETAQQFGYGGYGRRYGGYGGGYGRGGYGGYGGGYGRGYGGYGGGYGRGYGGYGGGYGRGGYGGFFGK